MPPMMESDFSFSFENISFFWHFTVFIWLLLIAILWDVKTKIVFNIHWNRWKKLFKKYLYFIWVAVFRSFAAYFPLFIVAIAIKYWWNVWRLEPGIWNLFQIQTKQEPGTKWFTIIFFYLQFKAKNHSNNCKRAIVRHGTRRTEENEWQRKMWLTL